MSWSRVSGGRTCGRVLLMKMNLKNETTNIKLIGTQAKPGSYITLTTDFVKESIE
jgi:hypothetical protein